MSLSGFTCALIAHLMCRARGRSGDSTARIWDLSKLREGGEATSISLPHSSPDDKEKPKDVTTLDWSGNGQLLATGSYDGLARVWSKEGALPGSCREPGAQCSAGCRRAWLAGRATAGSGCLLGFC